VLLLKIKEHFIAIDELFFLYYNTIVIYMDFYIQFVILK